MNGRETLFFVLGCLAGWVIAKVIQSRSVPPQRTFEIPKPKSNFSTHFIKTSVTQKFVVDGVTYSSIDDVPEKFRNQLKQALRDDDRDGIPDMFQKK